MPFELGSVRLPDPNAALTEGFRCSRPISGLALPPMQLGDTPEESRAIWEHLPPLYWLMEAPELKPAARVLAEDPNRTAARRPQAAGDRDAVRRSGQGAVPRDRRNLALAFSGGRRLFRPLLDSNDPLPEPLETCRERPARGAFDRSPRVCAGRAGAVARAVRRRAARSGRGRRRDGRRRASGPANAENRASPHVGPRDVRGHA